MRKLRLWPHIGRGVTAIGIGIVVVSGTETVAEIGTRTIVETETTEVEAEIAEAGIVTKIETGIEIATGTEVEIEIGGTEIEAGIGRGRGTVIGTGTEEETATGTENATGIEKGIIPFRPRRRRCIMTAIVVGTGTEDVGTIVHLRRIDIMNRHPSTCRVHRRQVL